MEVEEEVEEVEDGEEEVDVEEDRQEGEAGPSQVHLPLFLSM